MQLGVSIDFERSKTLLGLATPEEFAVTKATHTRSSSVRNRAPSLTVERTTTTVPTPLQHLPDLDQSMATVSTPYTV